MLVWIVFFLAFLVLLLSLYLPVRSRASISVFCAVLFVTVFLLLIRQEVATDRTASSLLWYSTFVFLPWVWFLAVLENSYCKNNFSYVGRLAVPIAAFVVILLFLFIPELIGMSDRTIFLVAKYIVGIFSIFSGLSAAFMLHTDNRAFFRVFSVVVSSSPLIFPFALAPFLSVVMYSLCLVVGMFSLLVLMLHSARHDILPVARELIFDAIPDPVVVLDNSGKIRFINRSCERLAAVTLDEVKLKEIESVFPGSAIFMNVEAGIKSFDFQLGSVLFNVKVTSIEDRTRKIGTLLYFSDVTVERSALEALTQSEKRYRDVINNITVGILLLGTDYEVRARNKKMEEWFPLFPWDTEGLPCFGICGKGTDRPCSDCPVSAVLSDGNLHQSVIERNTAFGKRVFSVIATPQKDSDGNLMGVIQLLEDITAQRYAQDILERYKFVVNAAHDFMSLISKDYIYEAVNDSFCEAYGMPREAFVGKPVRELWGDDVFFNRIKPPLEEAFSGKLIVIQDRFSFGNLGERDLEVSYNPYFEDEGVTHVAVITRDITAYKEAQRIAEEAKKQAEEANAAKSAFLASMSHEIRTPLNAVLGMTDLLLMSNPPSEFKESVNIIKSSASSLLDLLNDILDMSRIESGRIELENIGFDLVSLIERIWKMFLPLAAKKGLDMRLHIPESMPRGYMGDPVRIQQIIVNLLSNAVKFTDAGFIELSVNLSHLYEEDYELEISISDTGSGIAEEKLSSIFDPFSQADSSITRRYGGTGLGLSISRKLATMMRGTIVAKSQLGRGSTFTCKIILKHTDVIEKTYDKISSVKTPSRVLSILVVEDNELNSLVAEKLIEAMGHSVYCVESGSAAIEFLKTERVDLIFMDIEMPDMDGFSCTRAIRSGVSGNKACSIPIFAMTAHALIEVKKKVEDAGMNGILLKPVSADEIARIINTVADGDAREKYNREEAENALRFISSSAKAHVSKHDTAMEPVFDKKEALLRMAGNRNMLAEFMSAFVNKIPDKITMLDALKGSSEMSEIARAGHSLKGVCGNIGAKRCEAIAKELEKAGKDKDIEEAERLLDSLIEALTELENVLKRELENWRRV
ncbi:ATP-binding protein [Spirochaetia bacterium 38H-sp]|uniref:histidine kinase n=1 Tax=Rarispira pelagica TaxID=3141764 RepID=A0ABU9UC93_9SPIR